MPANKSTMFSLDWLSHAEQFSLVSTKAFYIINYGLAKLFVKELEDKLKSVESLVLMSHWMADKTHIPMSWLLTPPDSQWFTGILLILLSKITRKKTQIKERLNISAKTDTPCSAVSLRRRSYLLHTYATIKLILPLCFVVFIKWKSGNQLKFQQYSTPFTHSLQAALSLDAECLIAPKLWLPNISDFNAVDYRIWAVIREWVYQQPVRDVDELRRCLIDTSDWQCRWSLIKRLIGGDLGWGHELG